MELKIAYLWPEIALFITTCCVMILGQSRFKDSRSLVPWIAGIGVIASGVLAYFTTPAATTPLPNLPMYGKVIVAAVGFVLLLLSSGTVDRELEARPGKFDVARAVRGEFYSFLLFSLTGLMLCAGADDLIFLFLALELTSLPTYVMVAVSTGRNRSMEAAVKYFFLGALGAAVFLYGFALIYGGTGSTSYPAIAAAIAQQSAAGGGPGALVLTGLVIALLGVCFKIAAVPMHFYTPDVYQGAAAPVGAFLAFVPKAAGFFAIMGLVSLAGWHYDASDNLGGSSLPAAIRVMLWVIAALTMTIGNVLAIMQSSVKRLLAYSSIAHSGYMLVGIVAGPGEGGGLTRNGLGAVIFYLAAYGITTVGAFAAVACVERRAADGTMEEPDRIDDLRGLVGTHPLAGWTLIISSMGLLGLPPLLGFLGKIPLFTSALGAGETVLVVVLALNSAIAAYYYLRLAYVAFIDSPEAVDGAGALHETPFASRQIAGWLSMVGVVGLAIGGWTLGQWAEVGGRYARPHATSDHSHAIGASIESAGSTADVARSTH